jgi:WD40 repeat protein
LRNELGDLAENRIPADLAARIGENEDVAGQFDLRSRNHKLLISLREDFLPDLEGWCKLIPTLGRSRARLLRLRISEAVDAVHDPASAMMTHELARQVVDIIAGENLHTGRASASPDVISPSDRTGAAEVEPALLSLFCRELNEERKRRGQAKFDEKLIEDAKKDTLSNYYSSCVRDLPPRVARFIESELITEKGFRDSYIREDAVPAHITEDELDRLISSRLVRLEDRDGAPRIELTHDVLTGAVREHRDKRRAEEDKAALAEAAKQARAREQAAQAQAASEERDKLKAQEQAQVLLKRTRVLYALLAAVVIVAMVAVFSFGLARKAQSEADARLRDARDANADKLYTNSVVMLGGNSRLGGHDTAALQMLLAALAIAPKHEDSEYELLTVATQERDLLKIIDLPVVVTSVAFSPDGSRMVSGSADNTVRVWNTATGQPIGQPMRHDDRVMSVAFSPDGTRIASGSADNTVRMWNAATGQPIGQPMRHDGAVYSVAFSPNGTRIATASANSTARLWDTATGAPIGQPMGHTGAVNSVAFSPNGTRVATASDDNTARLWDAATGAPIGQPMGHYGAVYGVAFSPDGTRIATASADTTVRLWDTATGQPIGQPMRHDDAVNSVAFSPDGTRIATASADTTVRLWDTATSGAVGVLRGHEAPVTALAFSPDGLRLVSSSSDGTVRLWDATSWQPMVGHYGTAWAAFFDDGRRIGSGSWDKTVRWWDTATGRPIGEPLRVNDSDVEVMFPVTDNRLLSFGSVDTVRLWDGVGRPIGQPLRLPPDPDRFIVADDTANPRIAAQLEPGVVQLYDADLRPVGQRIRQEQPISIMEFSRDGRIMATGAEDGAVQLWDSSSGAPIGQSMKGTGYVTSIAFSRDGHRLAVGCSCYSLRIWDTGTYQPVGEPMSLDSVANTAAFSPDGRMLASGSDDGSIQLWDVGDQSPLGAPLTGHTAFVTSLDFSPDGTKLLSASEDHTLRLWPVAAGSLETTRDALCAKLTHNMSREQWNKWVSPQIDYIPVCKLPEADYAG